MRRLAQIFGQTEPKREPDRLGGLRGTGQDILENARADERSESGAFVERMVSRDPLEQLGGARVVAPRTRSTGFFPESVEARLFFFVLYTIRRSRDRSLRAPDLDASGGKIERRLSFREGLEAHERIIGSRPRRRRGPGFSSSELCTEMWIRARR